MKKPNLACDVDLAKLRFPCWVMPKIDGVRGLSFNNEFTGRSLKKFANRFISEKFNGPYYNGFDGELAAENETNPKLCALTTSALSTLEGEPYVLWHLFDLVTSVTINLPYAERYSQLCLRVAELQLQAENVTKWRHLRVVPYEVVNSVEEAVAAEERYLAKGYEGIIYRDPHGKYKQGRSTVREGGYMRGKRFMDTEAEVIELLEGNTNNNQAQTNELGQQYRSSHKENLMGNGQVGTIVARLLDNVYCPVTGKELFSKGDVIDVSPGQLSHQQREQLWSTKEDHVGRVFKFKHFPIGVKDKPRFPIFLSFRSLEDMS